MIILMERSQSKLEKKEKQKRTKKISEDSETIDKNENSKQIVQKLNGDQYMRL